MRSINEIRDEENEAAVHVAEGTNPFPGMTYADGVSAALRWATGDSDDRPMSE